MTLDLTDNEARIIGCLMEKSVVTPDQYPLTVNALTLACNQKSSRNPVMSLDRATVQRTARELGAKHLVQVEENFKTGVERYKQRFCNTTFSDYQFDPPEYAVVCLLLLRGPQTPGELKARSGRLHAFADNAAVVDALTTLIDRDGGPLVVKLPRKPGRRDSEYMHLFTGMIDNAESRRETVRPAGDVGGAASMSLADLAERVARLESEVKELKELLQSSP